MQRSLGFWVNLAIFLTFIVVGVFGVASYQNTTALVDISEKVAQTHKVLRELESLMSILLDAETSQRGFVITGDEKQLDPYHLALLDFEGAIVDLRERFASNPLQNDRFYRLEIFSRQKLERVERVIEARRDGGLEGALKMTPSGEGTRLMAAARKIASELETEENRLLELRRQEVDQNARASHRAIIAGHVIVFALLALAGFAVRDERRQRDAMEQSRRTDQQQIREQATLLDKIRDAILVCDMNGKIVYWNHASETLYGWSATEAIGEDADRLLGDEGQSANHSAIFQDLFAMGAWSGELQHVDKERKKISVEQRRTLIRDGLGQPQKQLIINIDITERKQHEEQAARRQRLESIGMLAGGIAHDLNNILAPILLGSELLASNRSSTNSAGLLATIRTSAERGAEMVQKLLAFAGGVEGEHVPLKLTRVVDEVHTILRHTFPKSIQIDVLTPQDLWMVNGDNTGFTQVLLNLCVNARDAMPAGGQLSIVAANQDFGQLSPPLELAGVEGKYVVLSVADSGMGIAPDIIDKIFDPFFTTKEFGRGTGMGLSTSLGIIKSHHGALTVRSVVNEGSTFAIYLPAFSSVDTISTVETSNDVEGGRGELILIVDDEVAIQEMVGAALKSRGFQFVAFTDGQQAETYLRAHSTEVHAAIIDMMMPVMDGPETMTHLIAVVPNLKIIAMSGLRVTARAADAQAAGAKLFLPKPFNDEQLLKALHYVLRTEDLVGAESVSD